MERTWYLVNKSVKIGPYNERVLRKLLRKGSFSPDQLFWAEDLDEPVDVVYLYDYFDEENPYKSLEEKKTQKKDLAKKQKPLKKPQEKAESKSEVKSSRALWLIPLFLLMAFIGVWFHDFYWDRIYKPSRLAQLQLGDYRRLLETRKSNKKSGHISFAVSKDMKKIIGMSNSPYSGKIEIRGESLYGKTLGDERVVFKGQANLEDYQVIFNGLELEKGKSLTPGYYEVDFIQKSFKTKFWWMEKFKKLPKITQQRIVVYLGNMPLEKFKKNLLDQKQKKESGSAKYWNDLLQKYETLSLMFDQIKKKSNSFFDKENIINKDVKNFEDSYARSFGRFFSDFIIRNRKSYQELRKLPEVEQEELVPLYDELTPICRKVGFQMAKSIEDMANVSTWSRDQLEEQRSLIKKVIESQKSRVVSILETIKQQTGDN